MSQQCEKCGADITERGRFARFCVRHAPPRRISPRDAIKAKCKDCIHDPLAGGTWIQQVEACTFQECSLYPFRPVSRVSK